MNARQKIGIYLEHGPIIAEGYATAASLHDATGLPVACIGERNPESPHWASRKLFHQPKASPFALARLRVADTMRRWKTKRRTRAAFRRWGTPEEQWAYTCGMNRGAVLGILWSSVIGALLVGGLWLAGAGL